MKLILVPLNLAGPTVTLRLDPRLYQLSWMQRLIDDAILRRRQLYLRTIDLQEERVRPWEWATITLDAGD